MDKERCWDARKIPKVKVVEFALAVNLDQRFNK